jgi:DNA-binding IclR family transcriptional regulator
MSAAWDHADVASPLALLVLLALANHADDAGHCWPSVERIAHLSRCSGRTVQRQLTELETAGLVVRELGGGSGHTSRYRVLPGLVDNMGRKGDRETPLAGERVTEDAQRVTENARKGDTAVTLNRQETSRNAAGRLRDCGQAPALPPAVEPDELRERVGEIRDRLRGGPAALAAVEEPPEYEHDEEPW